jgi:pyruvate/2-oxoglutarate dehydrogenase complex dihydrolipoamide acyltransferase (E2) component
MGSNQEQTLGRKTMIIVALLVVIILLMFKPIRQLVGLLFLFLVGCYFYGTHIATAPVGAAIEAPAAAAPAPAPIEKKVTPSMPSERPFTSPPTPSFPTEAEMNRLTRGKSERDVTAAFGIALYIEYDRCTAALPEAQRAAVKAQKKLHGPLIDGFVRMYKAKETSCEEITRSFETFIMEMAKNAR